MGWQGGDWHYYNGNTYLSEYEAESNCFSKREVLPSSVPIPSFQRAINLLEKWGYRILRLTHVGHPVGWELTIIPSGGGEVLSGISDDPTHVAILALVEAARRKDAN